MISKERAVEMVFGVQSTSDNFPDCSETSADLVMAKFRLIAQNAMPREAVAKIETTVTEDSVLEPVPVKGRERVIFNPGRCAI